MFRLEEQGAVINRYGFNSDGAELVLARIKARFNYIFSSSSSVTSDTLKSGVQAKLLGINVGKNKTSKAESNDDYVEGVKTLGAYADYLVVNISSPNTPGLRDLQRKEALETVVSDVVKARDEIEMENNGMKPALLVKIAPDVSDQEMQDIAEVLVKHGVDGVIISNTTIQRPPSVQSLKNSNQKGGLSGRPLKPLALAAVRKFYTLTNGQVPIVGCGGISSGKDAMEFIEAGASAIQVYTALAYEGPGLVREIKDYLTEECHKRGVSNISQLVGSASQGPSKNSE